MTKLTISLSIMLSGCASQYSLYIKPNEPWEPGDSNTRPTDEITSDTPEGNQVDSDQPTVDDTPIVDTDSVPSEIPDDTPIDTEIQHPTMDTDGNPLYPTIPEDFTDTGVIPPGVTGTVEDCNIPDDFMLVTYVDLDQDGFGSDPYMPWWSYAPSPPLFSVVTTSFRTVDYYADQYSGIGLFYGFNPLEINSPIVSQPVPRSAISIFSDIYNFQTGIERLNSAVNVINNEGGLSYALTSQMAMTTHRKQFRDELVHIAQQRCASDNGCYRTNYREVAPSHFGFYKDIFLTYTMWCDDGYCYTRGYDYDYGSPFSAAFWRGDFETSYDYQYVYNGQVTYFDRLKLDLNPRLNEGFFTCSWFGDDVDGDGFTLEEGDCHDGAAWISPAASEIPSNGVDNNCDGYEDCFTDSDGDGRAGLTNTITITGTDCNQYGRPTDCNDSNPLAYPGAPENSCDGIDQDCDGTDM